MKPGSIEEINVDRTFYHRERDAFGNTVRTPYTKKVRRKVEIVETGTRFGYFFIDSLILILLQVGLFFLELFVLGGDSLFINIALNLGSWLLWFGYYFLFEFLKQQTPGKMLLGYVVIDNQTRAPSLEKILVRTLCRMIPFESFSCLSDKGGWHDRFSQTYVVSKKERDKLQSIQVV